IMSPRLLSQAKPLQGRMIFEGFCGEPMSSGSRDAGVHTSLYEFALTCSQLLAGICNINGSNGPEPTYGGIDWPKAPPASSPAVTNKISQRTNVVVALEWPDIVISVGKLRGIAGQATCLATMLLIAAARC